MARVKVSIMEVEGLADHAVGFDDRDLAAAADRAIAWLVGQVRPGATLEKPEPDATGGAATPEVAPISPPVTSTRARSRGRRA